MNILEERKFNNRSVVVIGKFDGVHKGHQHLISLAGDICRRENLAPVAFTFSNGGECITDDAGKAQLLAQYGMENIYIQPLDAKFKSTLPEEFVDVLKDCLLAQHIIVGFNFRFGKDRCGDADIMTKLCRDAGINITVAEPVLYGNEPISSTRIRECIKNGNITAANSMLGRNFEISGIVIHGKQLGREIDFPTANMVADDIPLLPGAGVYATAVRLHDRMYPAITNIGSNPTVDHDDKIKVETNIIGFDGDLYGRKISVCFLEKLRDERTFANIGELKNQLSEDRERAIKILNNFTEY